MLFVEQVEAGSSRRGESVAEGERGTAVRWAGQKARTGYAERDVAQRSPLEAQAEWLLRMVTRSRT